MRAFRTRHDKDARVSREASLRSCETEAVKCPFVNVDAELDSAGPGGRGRSLGDRIHCRRPCAATPLRAASLVAAQAGCSRVFGDQTDEPPRRAAFVNTKFGWTPPSWLKAVKLRRHGAGDDRSGSALRVSYRCSPYFDSFTR
jgi:hypothetical protein